jgi:hypothetical protein
MGTIGAMILFAGIAFIFGGVTVGCIAWNIAYQKGREDEAKIHRPEKDWKKEKSVSYKPKD